MIKVLSTVTITIFLLLITADAAAADTQYKPPKEETELRCYYMDETGPFCGYWHEQTEKHYSYSTKTKADFKNFVDLIKHINEIDITRKPIYWI